MSTNSKNMLSLDEMHDKIRKDIVSGNSLQQEEAIKSLLPAFSRFVKDTVKRGDFTEFKKNWELEKGKDVTNEDYIVNLADIFLEPFLPFDLSNPEKHVPFIERFAKKYIKYYM